MSVLEVKNINKSFGKTIALEDMTLTLKENCIYGLLGRNGAGKSTLLGILSGRLHADSGEFIIDGEKAAGNDRQLGKIHMMSEQLLYDPKMKITEMFKTAALFYPDYDMEYALKLCDEYKLDPKKKLNKLSTGYRTIASCINALSCGAEFVFLDEPVLGIDANHRDMFYKHIISRYNEKPATYVISTHLIEESANLIERAIVIKEGKLLFDKDTDELKNMGYIISGKDELVRNYAEGKKIIGGESLASFTSLYILGEPDALPEGVTAEPMTLQQLFIQLTNS